MSLQTSILLPVTTGLDNSRSRVSRHYVSGFTHINTPEELTKPVCSGEIAMPKDSVEKESRSEINRKNGLKGLKKMCFQKKTKPKKQPKTKRAIAITELWKTPEYRAKQEATRKKLNWGKLHGDILVKWNKEHPEEHRKASVKGAKAVLKFKSSLETKVEGRLKEFNIKFEDQYVTDYCLVDQAIFYDNIKIAVFEDGNYWHNYPDGRECDRKITEKLVKDGWTVLRFWETDIKSNFDKCINEILSFLPIGYHGQSDFLPAIQLNCIQLNHLSQTIRQYRCSS